MATLTQSRILVPKGDRVVVKRTEVAEKTPGGIYRTDTAKKAEQPYEGTVIAVGPDVKNCEKGELVLYPRYAGADVTLDGEEYKVFEEKDILARIDEPTNASSI